MGLWGDYVLRWQLTIKCATNDVLVCSYLIRCTLDVRIIEGKLSIKKYDVRVVISPRVNIDDCDVCFLVSPDHRNRCEEWQSLRPREESKFGKLYFLLLGKLNFFCGCITMLYRGMLVTSLIFALIVGA